MFECMPWRDPREAALILAKIILALVISAVATIAVMVIVPLGDFSPQTPGRAIMIIVFYSVWAMLTFKFLFGEYIPRESLKRDNI
ncbi:hypothetical protein IL252_04080 [Halomicrobium sp. IBSBa]|uniref:hypothetical protein n=1 Tax=Halomicrobium sp. IBSBa TaxID=2778916 RepID=UPI001ABF28DA|nr:hypothetical protein [Halomicrobium sp. IBSBa]MBO4247000.1 hypothetical protein [Halomicrobium sp. IBSBa]